MWNVVADLKAQGVTIILTTHYIEEAEAIADRVGVINKGEILLVEDKASLMRQMGQKELEIELAEPLSEVPAALAGYALALGPEGRSLVYTYDTRGERTGIVTLLSDLRAAGLQMTDLATRQSSLEDIFVGLVRGQA
jgi:ABC-2 type transport system ATP-binding protein